MNLSLRDSAMGALPVIDSSCNCHRCISRTKEMYDLPGQCLNCGTAFTVQSRKGDEAPLWVDCPACGVAEYSWRVYRRSEALL